MTNYRTKVNECSSYLKKRGFVRNIYLAAESQANGVLEFVAELKEQHYKCLNEMQT